MKKIYILQFITVFHLMVFKLCAMQKSAPNEYQARADHKKTLIAALDEGVTSPNYIFPSVDDDDPPFPQVIASASYPPATATTRATSPKLTSSNQQRRRSIASASYPPATATTRATSPELTSSNQQRRRSSDQIQLLLDKLASFNLPYSPKEHTPPRLHDAQTQFLVTDLDTNQSSLIVSRNFLKNLQRLTEVGAIAALAFYCLRSSQQESMPKRFIPIDPGTAMSITGTVLSWGPSAAKFILCAYGAYKANAFIHAGCKTDLAKVEERCNQTIREIKTHYHETIQSLKCDIETRLTEHEVKTATILRDVGGALKSVGEELNSIADKQGDPKGTLEARAAEVLRLGTTLTHANTSKIPASPSCCGGIRKKIKPSGCC